MSGRWEPKEMVEMNPSGTGNKALRSLGTENTCRAFSIVEILVVLAIFSMMVGVFVTGFSSLQNGFSRDLELKDEIQQAIRLARREAGKSQMNVFIWYPVDHSYIGITRGDGKIIDDDGKELPKIDLKDKIPFQFLEVEANRELASICVDPSGVLTPFRLAYRAENREFQTYEVDIFSGQLTLVKQS
jgi:prepilin-type N-terminal cleavage/methylation domain-containing protein